MSELICMVGLQGSGKSTIAQDLKNDMIDCEIVSSDQIRKEHNYQISNDKVFQHYYARAKELLQNGKSVILDATNITMKSRKQIFEKFKGVDCKKTAYIVNTPINICAERLLERNQEGTQPEVPLDVLYKYQKSFEVPFYEEGWDDIIIHNVTAFREKQFEKAIEAMYDYDQKNSHHKYSLGEHCNRLEKYLKKTKLFPKHTGMLHDIGKMFTQTIDEEGQAHYYQHHCVGAYFLISHTFLIEDINILDLVFFVNYHMMPFNWQSEKAIEKWKGIFGENKFERLKILNEGDKESSGTQ